MRTCCTDNGLCQIFFFGIPVFFFGIRVFCLLGLFRDGLLIFFSFLCICSPVVFLLFSEKAAEHPEIAGLTAAYCYFDTSNLGSFYVYMPKDPRAAYLVDLGLDLPENIRALDDGSFFFMTVSSENIDVLNDLDLIVTWGESDTLAALQADPLVSQVPAVGRGSVVFLSNDTTLIAASCTPTTLAIEATIDEYLSLIGEAAAKLG